MKKQLYGWALLEIDLLNCRVCYTKPDGTGEVWCDTVAESDTISPFNKGVPAKCVGPVGSYLRNNKPLHPQTFDPKQKLNLETQVPYQQFMSRENFPESFPILDKEKLLGMKFGEKNFPNQKIPDKK